MKKFLSGLVALVMMLNIVGVPVWAETEKITAKAESVKEIDITKDKAISKESLEKAVKLVKAKIDIPVNYTEFNSEVTSNDGKMVCRLRWSSDSMGYNKDGGSLDVAVDEHGTILSYYNYKYIRDYEYKRRLPTITKTKAIEVAKKFVYFIAPDITDQISFDADKVDCSVQYDGYYRINFYRQYKNIPFYENGISMAINGSTCEITEYNRNWNEKYVFPEPDKAVDIGKAKAYFKKNLGLELKYRRTFGENKDTTYLEYSPASINMNGSVDAFTGEKVTEPNRNNPYVDMGYKYEVYRRNVEQSSKELNLTEEEMNKLKKMQGLISVESAEKLVRSMAELGIDSSHTMSRYNYYEYGDNSGQYALRMDFVRPVTKDELGGDIPEEKLKVMIAAGEFGHTAMIILNAKTSELLSFSSYGRYGNMAGKNAYKKEELRKSAEVFLGKYKAEKFKQSILLDIAVGYDGYLSKYNMPYYNGDNGFIYNRKVNGIRFEDNQISICFDQETGKISYYNENWDDLKFSPVSSAIDLEKAYEVLFKENPMEQRYTIAQPTGEIRLVYGFSIYKPVCVDATKALLIGYYNAEPFRGKEAIRYEDIEKHSAREQIQALAEIGILPAADSFYPDKVITQKEWLLLIGKAKGSYYTESTKETLSQKELDGMYRMMMNEGILEEVEKDPDSGVTRENAVRYLLNAIGYKKFASLEGIFNCDFADKNKIDPKNIGYAAIAKSLKLTNGDNGYFKPKNQLTRAEAAVMIYNYMKS